MAQNVFKVGQQKSVTNVLQPFISTKPLHSASRIFIHRLRSIISKHPFSTFGHKYPVAGLLKKRPWPQTIFKS
jgi:hypothetical protein